MRKKDDRQLGLGFEVPEAPAEGQPEDPRSKKLRELVEQVRRDTAVLRGDPSYIFKGDQEFYERRISVCRASALKLHEELEAEK